MLPPEHDATDEPADFARMSAISTTSTPPNAAEIKRTLSIIWAALLGAVGMYTAIYVLVGRQQRHVTSTPLVTWMLAAVAVSTLVGAWAWHRTLIKPILNKATATGIGQLNASERRDLQGRLQSGAIVCSVFAESSSIYGLVDAFTPSSAPRLFPWLGPASVLALVVVRARVFPAMFAAIDRLEPPA